MVDVMVNVHFSSIIQILKHGIFTICFHLMPQVSSFWICMFISFTIIVVHVLERVNICQKWSCILNFFSYVMFCNHWVFSLVEVSVCNITTSFSIDHMTSTSIWWTLEMELGNSKCQVQRSEKLRGSTN